VVSPSELAHLRSAAIQSSRDALKTPRGQLESELRGQYRILEELFALGLRMSDLQLDTLGAGAEAWVAHGLAWIDREAGRAVEFLRAEGELSGPSDTSAPFDSLLAEPASLAELNEFEVAGPPPPDGSRPSVQPLPKRSPMPTSDRGWEELVDQWVKNGTYVNDLSRESYRSRALRVPLLLEGLGVRPAPRAPTDFRREHVETLKYRARAISGPNRGRPLAPTTVVPLLSALHDLLSFYARRYRSVELLELVSDERLWRTRKPEPIRPARSLETPADGERLLRVCDDRTRVGVVLGLYSGLRVGEICSTEVRDLELSLDRPSWVTVRCGKESKPRRAPVPPVARNILLSAVHGLPPATRVYPVSRGVFRDDLAAASRRAGLGHVYPHRLRATFITFALRAGAPEQAVMDWAGHNKAETTKGYSDRDPVIEARARERFEAYLEEGA
jgi:integrase